MVAPLILLISGSLRTSSTNSALLRTAGLLVPDGVAFRLYDRMAALPAFNPDEDNHPLPLEVERLRDAVHQADAILFSTPEYAGALPGSLKNLLDWTIGDEQVGSIYDKPVAWVNASPRGAIGAHCELRTVLGYSHARIIDAACVPVPVNATMIGSDGLIHDEPSRASLAGVMSVLAAAARPREWPACGLSNSGGLTPQCGR